VNRYFILILFFQFISLNTLGQESDFGIWSSIEIKKKIADNYRLSVATESRFNNNASQHEKQNTEFACSYSPWKSISLGATYRFSQESSISRDFENSHRISADVSYETSWGRLKFKWRTKYQQSYSKLYLDEQKYDPKRIVRNKLSANYNIFGSRFEPYCSAELFTPISSSEYFSLTDKIRFSGGTSINLSKRFSSDIFYLHQIDLPSPLLHSNIIGIGLSYKL